LKRGRLILLASLDWHTRVVADKESPKVSEGLSSGELQYFVPQEVLDVHFPAAVRGYDRDAVDTYVKRVNRVIAELKVRGSPPAAVRHALEQAEGKVQGLLQAARDAADEITESARREAEESTGRAKAQAAELTVQTSAEADRVKGEADTYAANVRKEAEETVTTAKTDADEVVAAAKEEAQNILSRAQAEADERLRRLKEELAALQEQAEKRRRDVQADTEAVWDERHELLEDIRRMASGLVDLTNTAAARIQREEHAETHEQSAELDTADEIEPRGATSPDAADADAITETAGPHST
jgi:DivIVA domain-containing protein